MAAPSLAQLDPALQGAVESHKRTEGEAQNYTYTEVSTNLNFDANGNLKRQFSNTYEIIFLEGAPYRKHVLQNGQPLSAKEQKAEDARLAKSAKQRREHQERRSRFTTTFQFAFPLDQLAAKFEVSARGADQVDGREALVFTAIPKASSPSELKAAARAGTAFEMKFWVDRQDGVFSRIEGKVIAEGMRFEKDSVITSQSKKINDEAWLPSRFLFKGKVRFLKKDIGVETEQAYSDYRKFHSESRIVTQ